jgi:glycosyltransferase involved in cell wall biosynthesis
MSETFPKVLFKAWKPSRPLRVGVNCFLLSPKIGGMRQYFFNLFNELLINSHGFRFVFFYFKHNMEELLRLESREWKNNAILLEDQQEVARHLDKMDVYFCPFSALWPRPLPLPTVFFLHDIQEIFFPEFFSEEEILGRKFHYTGSSRMADVVVTNSYFTKNTIVQNHKISPKKVVVAHLAPDKRFSRSRFPGKPPEGRLPRGEFIIYPANQWLHKNHDVLLRALLFLKNERGLKIDAVFTGHPVQNGYFLLEKAREYGIMEQVFTTGYVTAEELKYLYKASKMMVFPSLFEGFGIPLVEAMASGAPVVASKTTSLPEVGGDAVEYFDPNCHKSFARSIESVWIDAKLRKKMIERGKIQAGRFTLLQSGRGAYPGIQKCMRILQAWTISVQ